MSDRTAIDYVDATWSPVAGCTPVSAGCQHCFAARYAGRRLGPFADLRRPGRLARRRPFSTVQCREDQLAVPLRWRRPRTILVPTLGDLFHPDVPDEFIDRVFGTMAACRYRATARGDVFNWHRFLVLTKRPTRMRAYLSTDRRLAWARSAVMVGGGIDPDGLYDQTRHDEEALPNLWLGVSVEDQATADVRIPILLDTPAAHRWVSVEPLLGPVDLHAVVERHGHAVTCCGTPSCAYCDGTGQAWGAPLSWVVCGGEAGPRARVCRVEWITGVITQAQAAGVPVWVKSPGTHIEADRVSDLRTLRVHERPAALEVGRG